MLKKISVFALAAVTAFGAYAKAEAPKYEIVNYDSGEIKITGEVSGSVNNSFVALEVLNPDVKAENIPKNLSEANWQTYFAFQNQLSVTNNKYGQDIILMPLDGESPYSATIRANGESYALPIYYYKKADIADFIEKLNSLDKNSDKAELENATAAAVRYFSLNTSDVYGELYDSAADKAEITKIFLANYNGANIEEAQDDKPYADIIKEYEKAIVTASYNSNASGKLCNASGDILYADLLNLQGENDSVASYAYGLSSEKTTPEGRRAIVGALCGKSFSSTAELAEAFKNEAVYAGIRYSTEYGSGTITQILGNENACAILAQQGWNQVLYNGSDKARVAKELYSNPAANSADLITKLNKYAADYPAGSTGGGSGSGSSSGSGGGNKNNTPSGGSGIVSGGSGVSSGEKTIIFEDVPSGHWAQKSIMALYSKNIVSGVDKNLFKPNDFVTREQFVKMLVSAVNTEISEDDECAFTDVERGTWYYPYVAAAVKGGIVSGVSETEFGIGNLITREQIAAMCFRALKLTSTDAIAAEEFKDSADVSEYAAEAVSEMRKLGIINGNENGEFLPKNYATRAEAAQIIFGIISM